MGENMRENVFDEQKCRICGCTWNNTCEGDCYWVEDDLCSACDSKERTVKINWWPSNGSIGSESEGTMIIEDAEIEKMREAGFAEVSIGKWIDNEFREEVIE